MHDVKSLLCRLVPILLYAFELHDENNIATLLLSAKVYNVRVKSAFIGSALPENAG